MNRREWLQKAAVVAAGVVAADQLDLLERLAPRRLYFRGADFGKPYTTATELLVREAEWNSRQTILITTEMVEDDIYGTLAKHLLKNGWAKHFQRETDSYIMRKLRPQGSPVIFTFDT